MTSVERLQLEQTVERAAASSGNRKAGERQVAESQRSRATETVRMTLTIVGNAVKAILSNETKVCVKERGTEKIDQ